MKAINSAAHQFCLDGKFLEFVPGRKSPFKFLRLATTGGVVMIILRKALRHMLFRDLAPGTEIRVAGRQTLDADTGEWSLKADEVVVLVPQQAKVSTSVSTISTPTATLPPPEVIQTPRKVTTQKKQQPPKQRILVCQNSSCRKRGSQAVGRCLEAAIANQNLTGQVAVVSTGCMDRCKAGPNVVMMPDKAKYKKVSPKAAAEMVRQHYGS